MSRRKPLSKEDSVGNATDKQLKDNSGSSESSPELRPSVEQEISARVDTTHPDAIPCGLTLEAEERLEAREWEIERTRRRFDRRQTSDREARSRRAAARGSVERRAMFAKRAASVMQWADPDEADPRTVLSQEDLGEVNQEAARIAERLERWSRAAVSRQLAMRVLEGTDWSSAIIETYEELRRAPGQIVPIDTLETVRRRDVDIAGRVAVLWEATHPRIQQVGLLDDGTSRVKFTVWRASNQPVVREGERVRFRSVARSWYDGQVSVALTGWSSIEFPDTPAWWTE